jgi:hypothetical protein
MLWKLIPEYSEDSEIYVIPVKAVDLHNGDFVNIMQPIKN